MNMNVSRLLARMAGMALLVPVLYGASAQSAPDASVHPITLPSTAESTPAPRRAAKKRTSAVANTAPTQPDAVPADQVHPITSLPKPPGFDTAAATENADVSAPVVEVVPAPQPVATPAAPAAAATFTQPVQPSAESAAARLPQPASEEASSTSAEPVSVSAPAAAPPMPEPGSVAAPDAPVHAAMSPAPRPAVLAAQALAGGPAHVKPFSSVALQIKVGFNGPGADIAVPLSQHLNARVGGTFFQYSGTYDVDGITIGGEVKFRSGNVALDYYPFHGTFRISPGFTFYNGNNINASAVVPAGQTFTLDDVTYTSGCQGVCPNGADPVRGSASMTFGSRKAPSLTMGWGNMVPRHGSRFSVPFEFGVQYISDPKISLALAGTACSQQGTVSGCGQLQSDPIAQANLAKEQQQLNDDIHPLRFYPILSIGISWNFGRKNPGR